MRKVVLCLLFLFPTLSFAEKPEYPAFNERKYQETQRRMAEQARRDFILRLEDAQERWETEIEVGIPPFEEFFRISWQEKDFSDSAMVLLHWSVYLAYLERVRVAEIKLSSCFRGFGGAIATLDRDVLTLCVPYGFFGRYYETRTSGHEWAIERLRQDFFGFP